ncbi:unnamed protein product, partial [Haemonchus placei]|uniref:C2 tensin-type domain-containing protein n=1 Tax=Haemonchus placei TaxID=6290 RepID=A0A0N4WE25_HAEPC
YNESISAKENVPFFGIRRVSIFLRDVHVIHSIRVRVLYCKCHPPAFTEPLISSDSEQFFLIEAKAFEDMGSVWCLADVQYDTMKDFIFIFDFKFIHQQRSGQQFPNRLFNISKRIGTGVGLRVQDILVCQHLILTTLNRILIDNFLKKVTYPERNPFRNGFLRSVPLNIS